MKTGELLVRQGGADPRRGFFSGYLKDEEATAEAWRDGWFHTGDAVRRGPDGALHFVDRLKNIIRRAGENIAALEVEAALAGHPAIAQVAVIAVPDSGARRRSYGLRRPQETNIFWAAKRAISIQDWCLERLAYFKAPGPRRVPRLAAHHRDQQGAESEARRFRLECAPTPSTCVTEKKNSREKRMTA